MLYGTKGSRRLGHTQRSLLLSKSKEKEAQTKAPRAFFAPESGQPLQLSYSDDGKWAGGVQDCVEIPSHYRYASQDEVTL